mmetsp:Transcript_10244/g.23385  ORF Transcript_10244/g.23385 Transcript_10244/m.23385 type:complete len:234 (-) Transcript_10244:27-728(-)
MSQRFSLDGMLRCLDQIINNSAKKPDWPLHGRKNLITACYAGDAPLSEVFTITEYQVVTFVPHSRQRPLHYDFSIQGVGWARDNLQLYSILVCKRDNYVNMFSLNARSLFGLQGHVGVRASSKMNDVVFSDVDCVMRHRAEAESSLRPQVITVFEAISQFIVEFGDSLPQLFVFCMRFFLCCLLLFISCDVRECSILSEFKMKSRKHLHEVKLELRRLLSFLVLLSDLILLLL